MSLDLTKALPKPGNRYALPALYGSSDAYALALAALALKARGQMLAVVVAQASDGQRLLDEIPWFGGKELRCHLLPDWETLPYDAFSPHQDLVSERLATLHEIQTRQCDVLIVPATTALVRLAPPSFLAAYTFFFKKGEKLDEARLKSQLTLAGYSHVSQVMSPGEYSVRGGLLDLFPMGSALPYRLDLFGDTIETIRTFDADTQRSLYPVHEVRLLPGREFPMDEAARTTFRNRWREQFEGDPSRSVVYKDIDRKSTGVAPLHAGFELFTPAGNLSFITETELYAGSGRRVGSKKQEGVTQVESMVRDLSELKIGDPVVHINHGIGRYMGLTSMDLGEGETEFLHLEYAKDTKLYVPVSQLHVISRYSGASPENAPLHRCATRPPSCSTCMRAARCARATRSNSRRTTTSVSPTASASTKRRTRPRPSTTSSRT